MATLTSHTLNAVDGTHAAGIAVALYHILASGERQEVFSTETDEGGRLSQSVEINSSAAGARYELVFQTGAYFGVPVGGLKVIDEVVIRLEMPDDDARYHIPLILSPKGYSVWWSS